jgi:hypothetical protein
MDDILTTAQKIKSKIEDIEKMADKLQQAGIEKASTSADYDRAIAITSLRLRNGVIEEWEGEKVGSLPATLIPGIAKGICYKESYDKEMGETGYKSLTTKIDAHKAVLNGLQSINKVVQ